VKLVLAALALAAAAGTAMPAEKAKAKSKALYGAIAYEQEVTPIAEPADFAAQAALWMKSLPKDQFPNTVELADLLVAGSAEDRFEWGLDVIIRGLASYLTSPPSAAAHWPQPTGESS